MNGLEDLRELMWGARDGWSTVQATFREWQDVVRCEEAFDRFVAQEQPGSVGRFGGRIEAPPFRIKEWRVWARKPYRWRVETDTPNGSFVEVGDRAWRPDLAYHGYGPEALDPPDLLPLDNHVAWIFDPRIALTELDVRVVGSAVHSGREAVRLVAVPGEEARRSHAGPLVPSILGWGWTAHDFELLVDAERGVLLLLAALLDDEEFARLEVTEVAFDRNLPEDLLATHEPQPSGRDPVRTRSHLPRPWRL
jgi:hypothetical protein